MMSLSVCKRWGSLAAALVLLAGCASNPAPVVNHSFGGGPPAGGPAPAGAGAGGVHTFATAEHANGTVSNGEYTVARGDTLYSIAFANSMDVRELASLNGISPPYVIHPGQVLKLQAGAPTVATATPVPAPVPAPAPSAGSLPPATAAGTPPPASEPVFGPVTTQEMTATGVAAAPAPAQSTAPVPTPAQGAAPGQAASAAVPTGAAPAAPVPAPVPVPSTAATPTPPPGATRDVAGIAWRWPASGQVVGGFQPGSGGDGAGLNIAGNMGDPVYAAAAGTVVYSGTGLPGYGALIIVKHNDSYLSAYGHNSKRLVQEGQHVTAGQEIALMGDSGASRVELHFEIRKDGKPVDPLGYLPAR